MTNNQLIIGTRLWKSVPPCLMEYEVIGIRKYEDNTQYELKCLTCTHGEPCLILVGGKRGAITFIQVLNDEEDKHAIWHNEGTTRYWFTKQHAQLERLAVHIREAENKVEEKKRRYEEAIEHQKALLDAKELLEEELKKIETAHDK